MNPLNLLTKAPPFFRNITKSCLAALILLNFVFIDHNCKAQQETDKGTIFPVNNAKEVNPDTHLTITFKNKPIIGNKGQIRVYNVSNNNLVDLLDLSLPAGPTNGQTGPKAPYTPVPYDYTMGGYTNTNTKPGTPSGAAIADTANYQLTIIGGFTDAFHFYPIIVNENTATIYLHNNLLEYGKSYFVEIDPGVIILEDKSFNGIKGSDRCQFTTKVKPPSLQANTYIVNHDGTGDFNTVQGAIDYIPDYNPKPVTIFIKNGRYEEIVYFRNKTNLTIAGENRDSVIVFYANNEVFNPHPINVSTNELEGTFPSRRAAFAVDHCYDIQLTNMTIKTTTKGQAEGLLINGERIVLSNVTIEGSGDALQTNGTVYYTKCKIIGDGDTVLGRGAAFFDNCELDSYSIFMWIRNTSANHGNIFFNCTFKTMGDQQTELARSPINKGKGYPYCEAVLLNCKLSGISPIGWGQVDGDTQNIHYWEYNSTDFTTGKPIDVSQRHVASRQLTMASDSLLILNYSNPTFVLGGWTPAINPILVEKTK